MYFSRILIPSSKYLKDVNILYSLTVHVYVKLLCFLVNELDCAWLFPMTGEQSDTH